MGSDLGYERLPRHLGRGALTSLFIHTSILFPLTVIAFILGGREEAQRAEEVELSFEEVDPIDLPDDLPPIDPREAETRPAKPEKLAIAPEPEPEPAPEEPKPEEQKPEEQPPPPEPVVERRNLKSVDFEIEEDQPENKDAEFLAEKNNRVEEQTRAERTNLEREQKGEESTSPSDVKDDEVGDDEDKIARLEDQASKLGRSAPDVTPHLDQSLSRSSGGDPKEMLSMRDLPSRQHQISPETADPALPRDPNALRALPDTDLQSIQDLQGRSGQAPRTNLRLSAKQYEYLFGDDAQAATQFAQTERSKKRGRFGERMAQVQSALENFIPEVRPGNQTALNTRAAPFAAFIARMHRGIHELWGFGYLVDLESKGYSSPLNDRNLATKLELVLNADGTVDKVTVVRSSGQLPFDAAAIDVVYSAQPHFVDPPRSIRSRDGKIYLHWSFHRDERQCATFGAEPFILDRPAPGGDRGPDESAAISPGGGGAPTGPSGSEVAADTDRELRRLERGLGSEPGGHAGHAHAEERRTARTPGTALPESDAEATRRATAQVARADDPRARKVADQWFHAYSRGQAQAMADLAAFPFHSQEGVAAQGRGTLAKMLAGLIAESPERPVRTLQMHTAASIRTVPGGLPSGFSGTGQLFAVATVGGDRFVLVLASVGSAWKAVGLVRR